MEQPLLSLPQELLGEILSFLTPKDTSSLASTSTEWNYFSWTKIAQMDLPGRFRNPLTIFKKINPKSIVSLALDLTDDAVADHTDSFVETLAAFKWLTMLQVHAPTTENASLYEIIYQSTQLKQLHLVDNYMVNFQLLERMSALRKLVELSITIENTDFEAMPIEELTYLEALKFPFSDNLNDGTLERIFTLTQLQFLDLTWCSKITHQSFAKIVKMTNLTKLDLSRCLDILAPSFELLADLPRLWCLDLCYHHTLGSKEVNIISRYPHLTCLYLISNNGLQSESYDCLTRLHNLRELHLDGRYCSLHSLTCLTNLRALHTGIRLDRHIIASLTHLHSLNLHDAHSEDAAWLSQMTWLKYLTIIGSSFGADSTKQVTAALLNTVVRH